MVFPLLFRIFYQLPFSLYVCEFESYVLKVQLIKFSLVRKFTEDNFSLRVRLTKLQCRLYCILKPLYIHLLLHTHQLTTVKHSAYILHV